MKHFHTDTRIICLSGLWYFSFDEAILMSDLYLQSFQKFQIWDIVSSKKEDEQFHYYMAIKSRPRPQIFPTLAILVACKLRNISHSELAV